MDRNTGHWWSPNDRYIASPESTRRRSEPSPAPQIGAEGTRVFEQRYPAAGTPNAIVELFRDGAGRQRPGEGRSRAGHRLLISPGSTGRRTEAHCSSSARAATSGGWTCCASIRRRGAQLCCSPSSLGTWLNLHSNLRPLRDGSLIWTSERDGFSHIYRFRGGRWTQLTRGRWTVREIEGVDERTGASSSRQHGLRRWRTSSTGSTCAVRAAPSG
jgi:dipeptidyl-peptidase-4